jgi:pyruvate kinase
MSIRTKIVCTIGPAVESLEKLEALIDAGMNVARLNFSHGTFEEHGKRIALLKEAREKKGVPLSICLDTKGPEVRFGLLPSGFVCVKQGDLLKLGKGGLPIHPEEVLERIEKGQRLLLDDGEIEAIMVEKGVMKILSDGVLKSGKKFSAPGADLGLPAMTEEDREDLKFGAEAGVDLVAASFIRSAQHVHQIKEYLATVGAGDTLVISKIESAQGMEAFDEIVEVSDGIMIARGDLGVELDLALVPNLQKRMIRGSFRSAKPVWVATQMLESMIQNPRPTRAEASDVANAIYDSATAVMLSGETAVGKYPIETVRLMSHIARLAEKEVDYKALFERHENRTCHDLSAAVALAAVKTAISAEAKAIFAFTASGATARLLSRLRPEMPIIAFTSNLKVYHQLASDWGVIAHYLPDLEGPRQGFEVGAKFALQKGLLQEGDVVVATAGTPFGLKGTTNMMMVETVGQVLLKGHPGQGPRLRAAVSLQGDPTGKIAVVDRLLPSDLSRLKKAKGLIVEEPIDEALGSVYARSLGLSFLSRAAGATSLLHEGQEILLDPARGLIWRGGQ